MILARSQAVYVGMIIARLGGHEAEPWALTRNTKHASHQG